MNQWTVRIKFAGWSSAQYRSFIRYAAFTKNFIAKGMVNGGAIASFLCTNSAPIAAQPPLPPETTAQQPPPSAPLLEHTIPTEDVLDDSPVWERWRDDLPNVLDDIRNTPALPPRVRLGLASNREWQVGAEDITLYDRAFMRGHYRAAFDEQSDEEYGVDVGYYLFPRGNHFNVSPLLGFRHLDLGDRINDGVNVGLVGTIALAPGTADLAVSYSLLDPFAEDEATLGSVTAAYHLTRRLRLASQVNWRHSVGADDIAVGVFFEFKLF
ncbi:MAG: hypothetical protein AAF974_12210 [Cyanobacteria bacterium P01_E01_bin.34]